MKKITIYLQYLICLITTLCIVGCTQIVTPSDIVESYPKQKKINLSVILVVTDSLQSSKHTWNLHQRYSDTWVIELGGSLAKNSHKMLKALFAHVDLQKTATTALNQKPDIIFIPQLVTVEVVQPTWGFQESIVTLAIKWIALDNQGNTIYENTVEGEAKFTGGTVFTFKGNLEENVNMAINRLFLNSYYALSAYTAFRGLERNNLVE